MAFNKPPGFFGMSLFCGVSLMMLIYSASAHSQPFPTLITKSENTGIVSERVLQLSDSDFEQLRKARINDRVELNLAATKVSSGPFEFQRIDLYAKDARFIVTDGNSERVLERSGRYFFVAIDGARSAGFSLDPVTGELDGLLVEGKQSYRISNRQTSAGGPDELHLHNLQDESEQSAFACENNSHTDILARNAIQIQSDLLPSLNAMSRGTAVLFEAVIAIDTDNEFLWEKFSNNQYDARDWIEDLFVRLNVIFERDLALRLLLGTTILREDNTPTNDPDFNADPEGFNDGLSQFGNHWSNNHQDVNRAFAALLAGKDISRNSFSGVAWVNAYCSNNYGYSFNRIGSSLSTSFSAGGVGHEIGHNLGSHHTHCEQLANNGADYVDNCYAQEAGCYDGPPVCPASGAGTIMSYCHQTPSGCDNSDVFHPLIAAKLDSRIVANTPNCIGELYENNLIISDGFEQ